MKPRQHITGKGPARRILPKTFIRPTSTQTTPAPHNAKLSALTGKPTTFTRTATTSSMRPVHIPAVPTCGGIDVWISATQASKILGVGRAAIYRLAGLNEPLLVAKRPLPRKILISLRSVTAFSEAVKDIEFWESKILQQQLLAKLKTIAENKA